MRFFPQSIRWRIQLWYALLLAVIIAALLGAFYQNQREILYQALDRELNNPITRLLPRMERRRDPPPRNRRIPMPDPIDEFGGFDEFGPRPGRGPGPNNGPREGRGEGSRDDSGEERGPTLDEVVEELAEDDIFVIQWDRGEELRFASANAPVDQRPIPDEVPRGGENHSKRTVDGYREVIHAAPGGGFLLVGAAIKPLEDKLAALALRLVVTGVLIVGGGFLVGWLLIGRSLKPIGVISDTAHRIAGGDLTGRIEVKGSGSELGKLSGILNETFEKLESSFEHQVRFTADASHEMRTPISVILAKSQLALSRERTPEKYQEALQTCMDSAQHMRALTDALLALSKVDSGEFFLQREEGNLEDLTREVVRMIEPLADERKIVIHCELEPLKLKFDRQRMRQAFLNLLSNAVKYNCHEGEIKVVLSEGDGEVSLVIRDTGPGMGAEALEHVFERFYRADKARTRDGKNGTGLGLAITKAIVEAHEGRIEVASERGKGSVFRVVLPK
ncbi:MAG: two-component system OmpR family sensor kinase [Akkermansiaceae bacterium]|jgi:two-component system OmpR family sensor kinase